MTFIELTLSEKHLKRPITINIDLIEAVYRDEKTSETKIRVQGESEHCYYLVKESYSEVMDKIRKAKRLEIASKLVDLSYKWNFDDGYQINSESMAKTALGIAEELIKQNEVME